MTSMTTTSWLRARPPSLASMTARKWGWLTWADLRRLPHLILSFILRLSPFFAFRLSLRPWFKMIRGPRPNAYVRSTVRFYRTDNAYLSVLWLSFDKSGADANTWSQRRRRVSASWRKSANCTEQATLIRKFVLNYVTGKISDIPMRTAARSLQKFRKGLLAQVLFFSTRFPLWHPKSPTSTESTFTSFF